MRTGENSSLQVIAVPASALPSPLHMAAMASEVPKNAFTLGFLTDTTEFSYARHPPWPQ
jgi:hypothetical protein